MNPTFTEDAKQFPANESMAARWLGAAMNCVDEDPDQQKIAIELKNRGSR
jgi:hypothetical protein